MAPAPGQQTPRPSSSNTDPQSLKRPLLTEPRMCQPQRQDDLSLGAILNPGNLHSLAPLFTPIREAPTVCRVLS